MQPISAFKTIADAAHGGNPLRIGRVVLDLLAQPADVNVNRAFVAEIFVAPDFGEDQIAREDSALVAHQFGEEVKFLVAQVEFLAATKNTPPGEVHAEIGGD